MNLYEANEKIMECLMKAIDEETGEIIDEQAYEELNSLSMQKDEKIENILLWVKELKAEAEALKAVKMSYAERQRAAEAKAESLRKYVEGALDGEKFKTTKVEVAWRKSQAVEYTGAITDLPEEYLRIKEPEINKTALSKALKSGVEISGATLVTRQNMQIK